MRKDQLPRGLKVSKHGDMVLNVHRNQKTYPGRGEGGRRYGGGGGGTGDYIPIAIDCHHQNDSYTEMGSDESHFNFHSL